MSLLGPISSAVTAPPDAVAANTLVITSGSAVANWSNNYVMQLYSNTTASTVGSTLVTTSNISGSSVTFSSTLTPGNYYYSVAYTSNPQGVSIGFNSPFQQSYASPPAISFTASGTTGSLTITAATGATSYSARLYSNTVSNSTTGTLVTTSNNITNIATPTTFTSLPDGTYYYVQCASSNGAGLSPIYTTSSIISIQVPSYILDSSPTVIAITKNDVTVTSTASSFGSLTINVNISYTSASATYKWFATDGGTTIYRTTGSDPTTATWTALANPTTAGITGVTAITDYYVDSTGNNIYMLANSYSSGRKTQPVIYYADWFVSRDGGTSWSAKNTIGSNISVGPFLSTAITVIGSNVVFGSGFSGAMAGFYSLDGGTTVNQCSIAGDFTSSFAYASSRIMYFNSTFYLFAVSSGAFGYITSTNGVNWSTFTSVYATGIGGQYGNGIRVCRDRNTGIMICSGFFSSSGNYNMLYSSNNVNSWTLVTFPVSGSYRTCKFDGKYFIVPTTSNNYYISSPVSPPSWTSASILTNGITRVFSLFNDAEKCLIETDY